MKHFSSSTRAYLAALVVASATALTACGGEGNAEPPATSAAVANTAPSRVLPPVTTNPPPTTAPSGPDTTTVPASVPSTTPAVSEEEQAKQAVIEAAEHAWYVFNEAKLDPTNDDKFAAAVNAHAGEAEVQVRDIISRYASEHLKSVPSTIIPAALLVDPASAQVDLANGTASVMACEIASNVLVQVGQGPDVVVNDAISAYSESVSLVRRGDEWVRNEVHVVESFEGAPACYGA